MITSIDLIYPKIIFIIKTAKQAAVATKIKLRPSTENSIAVNNPIPAAIFEVVA